MTIVEIGTIGVPFGKPAPCGGSTWTFAHLCKESEGKLYTVDTDPHSVAFAMEWTKDFTDSVECVLEDGRKFLKGFDGEIDILYLDGPSENPVPNTDFLLGFSRECLEACISKISPTSVIVFDDTNRETWNDKATGCPSILQANGFEPHPKQTMWVRKI